MIGLINRTELLSLLTQIWSDKFVLARMSIYKCNRLQAMSSWGVGSWHKVYHNLPNIVMFSRHISLTWSETHSVGLPNLYVVTYVSQTNNWLKSGVALYLTI